MNVDNRIVIVKRANKYILCHIADNRTVRLIAYNSISNDSALVGTIVNARVEKSLSEINSSFLRISSKEHGFVNGLYKCETVIPMQFKKEPSGNKKALYSSELSIAGFWSVVTAGESMVKVSSKINPDKSLEYIDYFETLSKELNVGIIIRTQAFLESIDFSVIEQEIREIAARIKYIQEQGANRPSYFVFYRPLPEMVSDCLEIIKNGAVEIVTDDADVFDVLSEKHDAYFGSKPLNELVKIRFYEDSLLSLSSLYAFESKISEALSKVVRLSNGVNIHIEQTEALVAIDVNSASLKIRNSTKEEVVLESNISAFREINRQIRLRNLSGIVIIDFINMKRNESYQRLSEVINSEIEKDYVKCDFHGFTRLGLAEFTRQKIKNSFYIQMRE